MPNRTILSHSKKFLPSETPTVTLDDLDESINEHEELRQNSKWFKDVVIHRLDDSSSKADIRKGHRHAGDKFNKTYSLMEGFAVRYQEAVDAGKDDLAEKIDKKFMTVACMTQYYCDQMERLIMIWSRKTGCPSIVCGDSEGYQVYDPSDDCAVDVSRNFVEDFGEVCRNRLQKVKEQESTS